MNSKRVKVGLAVGAILMAVAVLVIASISRATTFYYTVDEFRALSPQAEARYTQVNGTLARGQKWNPIDITLRFTLDGTKPGTAPLPVVYVGPKPSPFTPGTPVVVAGSLGADGVFRASQLMIKCPSTYTAKPGT